MNSKKTVELELNYPTSKYKKLLTKISQPQLYNLKKSSSW